MRLVDYWLNRITMYRLLLYYLLVLVGGAMLLGAYGHLPYSPAVIGRETAFLLLACWLSNRLFAYVFEAPHNPESALITALILTLIITPPASIQDFVFLSAAAGLAMASKYMLAIRGKHIFNPAAIAVVLTAWGAGQSASWWVGTTWMAPLVAIGGVLLVRKISRGPMVTMFLVAAVVTTTALAAMHGGNVVSTLRSTVLHSSLLFLAFVMLVEPLSSPTVRSRQLWYGLLVGVLFSPQVHVLHTYSTPELALVAGNLFAYLISPKVRVLPVLRQRLAWGPSVYDFIFTTDRRIKYRPGQYMEWTLPHQRPDSRGSRRYFTLASSPTENNLRIGVKFYPKGSSYKQSLLSMDSQTPIAAGQVAGDFVLPKDRRRKLVFIAGGIGITPFRSMLKYLVDTDDKRTITLLYSERDPADLAYRDVLKAAHQQLGTKVVYNISSRTAEVPKGMRRGQITPRLIAEEVPNYQERLFYVSGSQPMVQAVRDGLHALGVPAHQIKTDFFPGYA